jgi:trk system potassium uptake protein TrkA
MYIVVIGGGRVGYYLTKSLLDEGHEVLVIEKDAVICNTINEELGSICIRGDGCEASTLAEAGVERADMLVAVTGDDEDNLISCQVAKHKFNVPRIISRIRNPKNETLFKKLGIDVTISSTNVILESISEVVPTHPLTHLMTVRDKGLEIVEIKIPNGAATVGKAIKQLKLPEGCTLILGIGKGRNPLVPNADTIIEGGEQIIAVTPPASEEALRNILRGSEK